MDHHLNSVQRRKAFFSANQRQLADLYLAEPQNPFRQSGRSSGAVRWEETRRCITEALDADGSFLDVGCANGLLLETLQGWLSEEGIRIEPCGLDFIPELVELARQRVPAGEFWVGNAWDWKPPRRFRYVRTNLEYVLPEDMAEFVQRQMTWVEPGGRLILCHYRGHNESPIDVASFLARSGHRTEGSTGADGVAVAWIDL